MYASALFPANTTTAQACEELAAALLEKVLPFIGKQLDALAWDSLAVCAAAGRCLVPCCSTPSEPEQLHVAMLNASTYTLMWTTLEPTMSSTVQWGQNATSLTQIDTGSNDTYTHFGWRGQLHTVVLNSVPAASTVYYRVGDATGGWSTVRSFQSVDPAASTLRIAVVADMGYGPHSNATVAALLRLVTAKKIDLVLHDGDIGYADGDMQHWDVFMRKIEPIASRVPYMVGWVPKRGAAGNKKMVRK